jgi:hypothetical protein
MNLISDYYRAQNAELHARGRFGGSGFKHVTAVRDFADAIGAVSILDYGCGRGTLADALQDRDVRQYDPAIPQYAADPDPADLVVATDVLEHVEPECLDAVLNHLVGLARLGLYLSIATRPDGKKTLPDGRNPHLSLHRSEWWIDRVSALVRVECGIGDAKNVKMWCRKC